MGGMTKEYLAFKARHGGRLQVRADEVGDPLIPCWKRTARFGAGGVRPHVYRWSLDGKILAYVGVGNRKLGALLKRYRGVFFDAWQGDEEFEVKFPADRLDEVARSLGCRRRRKITVSDEQRARRAKLSTLGVAARKNRQGATLALQNRMKRAG